MAAKEKISIDLPILPIDRLVMPFRRLAGAEASGGILLIVTTVIALIWANSAWSESYFALWQTPVSIGIGDVGLKKPLLIWINDGLMAMFFFVIGLEIKREILVGELSTPRLAALPIAGAIGGMLIPAGIYCLFNIGTPSISGWGIPMATDIAFALGVLALFGSRVPVSLKIFLAALAIVDDLGAVLVIAFFYTSEISFLNLGLGAAFLVVLLIANFLGVRNAWVYAAVGIGGLWLAFLLSGIHPTIAGVLAALCIPARTRIDARKFVDEVRNTISYFENSGEVDEDVLTNRKQQAALTRHRLLNEGASTPLQRIESTLHPWVIFFIMPVFALSNAGVRLEGGLGEVIQSPVGLGIILGLLLGKQIGITGGAWIAVKTGLAALPTGVSWTKLWGVAWLGGIGFTMSLFIAGLAFEDAHILANAKIAILLGSLVSAIGGYLIILSVVAARKE